MALCTLLLLRRASGLTYRQFVALSVFEQHERYGERLMQTEVMHIETSGHPGGDPTIQLELLELASQQLIGALRTDGTIVPMATTWGGIGSIPSRAGLGQLRLLPAGETLCQLTNLADIIGDEERDHWLEAVRGPSLA